MNELVIPEERRFGGLRQALFNFAQTMHGALKANPNLLAVPLRDAFWALSLLWLIEQEVPHPDNELLSLLKPGKLKSCWQDLKEQPSSENY